MRMLPRIVADMKKTPQAMLLMMSPTGPRTDAQWIAIGASLQAEHAEEEIYYADDETDVAALRDALVMRGGDELASLDATESTDAITLMVLGYRNAEDAS